MARARNKLTVTQVKAHKSAGYLSDGGGLYLHTRKTGAKSWAFRFKLPGRNPQMMGLGTVEDVSLADARDAAKNCRNLVSEGIDPIAERKRRRLEKASEKKGIKTFKECTVGYIKIHSPGWKNAKHIQQWGNTLETYAYPEFGNDDIATLTKALVLRAVRPIWSTKTETAVRVRARIEAVWDWAKSEGYCKGENPARWRGNLEYSLPRPSRVAKVKHQPALPYRDIADFVIKLRQRDEMSALAVEFLILTASRSGEVRMATHNEIDHTLKIWTIPAERMKAEREHVVPLCDRALEIVKHCEKLGSLSNYIFPGMKEGRPQSDMTLTALLRRMEYTDITVHGFRSTFRDWAGEQTSFAREVIEAALAHKLKDKTEAAYFRANMLEKRRKLMNAWLAYCNTPIAKGGNVVAIGSSNDRRG